MNDTAFDIQREMRYGAPSADQILFNRFFTVGYSYYFRQAKWALEIVDPQRKFIKEDVERLDNFRSDQRIPWHFRPGLKDYRRSKFDRGHLVPSANQNSSDIQNSETFLLSNMSPQRPNFNRQIWRNLESAVRDLNDKSSILETYVITGPVFDYVEKIQTIGSKDKFGIDVPIPSHFYKSILAEQKNGQFKIWTFEMANKKLSGKLESYLVPTIYVEQRIGGLLWNNLNGYKIYLQKKKVSKMWRTS